MPLFASARRKRNVRFATLKPADNGTPRTSTLKPTPPGNDDDKVAMSDSSDAEEDLRPQDERPQNETNPEIPALFSTLPPIKDPLETESSELQDETLEECLPFLVGNPYGLELGGNGIPKLTREKHAAFLKMNLGPLPAQFVSLDASRPWMFYWCLNGLAILGEDVQHYADRLIGSLSPLQNRSGGFGGGHGHLSHVAASYAAVLSICIVRQQRGYEMIDRKQMWHWLGRMKQRDGGFTLCEGGEEDIRGAYCSIIILVLLNLPLELPNDSPARVRGDETFLTGLPEWITRCQSFEGGIGGAPDNEAHGAYAFCALGSLCLLGDPTELIPKLMICGNRYLDHEALLRWMSSRQSAPEGGFSGRANKLVDGCYSHWVGGCWPLIESALNTVSSQEQTSALQPESLWSREGLTRYILCCCQGKKGGLRDKPGKSPDAYHTCYNLAGLSGAQHAYKYERSEQKNEASNSLDAALHWTVEIDQGQNEPAWDMEDLVEPIHPVFVTPWGSPEDMINYFKSRPGF